MSLRILQVAHGYPPVSSGGTEIHVADLAGALGRMGHEVEVFHPLLRSDAASAEILRETVEGVPVVRATHADSLVPESNPAVERAFVQALDRFRPDVVHFHHLGFGSASLPAAAGQTDVPAVLTLHDFWGICPRFHLFTANGQPCPGPGPDGRRCVEVCWLDSPGKPRRRRLASWVDRGTGRRLPPGWLPGLERDRQHEREWVGRPARTRTLLGGFAALVAPSEHVRRRYAEFGVPGSILVMPHGVRTEWAARVRRVPGRRVRFGFIGGAAPHKGLGVLVDAFGRLPPGAAALVARGADWGGRSVAELAASVGAPHREHVRADGAFSRSELPDVLAGIDVLVVPSLCEESFGLAAAEARVAGAALVVADSGALPEHVVDGTDGLIVRAGDPVALATALRRFVDDPGLAPRFAAAAPPPRDVDDHARAMGRLYATLPVAA